MALCERASEVVGGFLADAQATGTIRADLTPGDVDVLIWERGIIARASEPQHREGFIRSFEHTLRGLHADV